MDDNYKMECYASGILIYLNDSFEVFFENEESMLRLVDDLPDYYISKYYKRSNKGEWIRIYLT